MRILQCHLRSPVAEKAWAITLPNNFVSNGIAGCQAPNPFVHGEALAVFGYGTTNQINAIAWLADGILRGSYRDVVRLAIAHRPGTDPFSFGIPGFCLGRNSLFFFLRFCLLFQGF